MVKGGAGARKVLQGDNGGLTHRLKWFFCPDFWRGAGAAAAAAAAAGAAAGAECSEGTANAGAGAAVEKKRRALATPRSERNILWHRGERRA